MRKQIKRINVGFLLTPNCREADIIETEAIFRIHPRNKIYYISHKKGVIFGKSQLGIYANKTYQDCPKLDVLFVGEVDEKEFKNKELIHFIKERFPKLKYIIGISNGVLLLHKAGVLENQKITADEKTLDILNEHYLNVSYERKCIKDGKILTAGPSTGGIEAAFTVFNEFRGKWLTKFSELLLEYNARVQYPIVDHIRLQKPENGKPLKVGVFAAPEIYVPDTMGAIDVFSSIPNTQFYYVSHSLEASEPLLDLGPTIQPNITFDACPQLDVLIIGATHPKYLKDSVVLDFILKQNQEVSAIISVCAGTFLVGSAGLLHNKKAATNYQQACSLPKIGVTPTGQEVMVDGKFYSAGPAIGSYEVALKAVEEILGRDWAQYIEHEKLEFSPNPVFGAGSVETADKSAVKVSAVLSKLVLNPVFNSALKKGYYARDKKFYN
ncbi:DJ-1/PfpI family protein [Aureivirga sp. CE67]|uniref:DJ-1/PfpI family protein n=1 Tax=Aureivirga sp. CE67 TaxID=1788983 RepID=UPI0018C93964|nr:DJ-1/PfpI family protein [Aureivirga sp. CE67]